MIALAFAAALATHFAPPLDVPLHYRLIDHIDGAAGGTVLESDATLRFRRGLHGLVAQVRRDTLRIAAPPRRKAALSALMTPLLGVTTSAEVDMHGMAGALVDPEASWAARIASRQALLARIDADPTIPPAARAAGRAAVAHEIDPASRDATLRAIVAELLPPPSPPQSSPPPGDVARSATLLATPGGPAVAESAVTLRAADAARLTYHVETTTRPPDRPGAVPTPVFAEVSEIVVARDTGLLLALDSRREMRVAGAPPRPIGRRTIRLAP